MVAPAVHTKVGLNLAVAAICLGSLAGRLHAQTASSSLPDNWQQLSQADFTALCETWIGVTSAASQADKTTLASFAWNTWLNDPTKAAVLTPDQFLSLSTLAISGLSNDDCQLLTNVFLRQFPANTNVQPLAITSLERLTGPVAKRLSFTNDQVNGWLQSWVDGHNGAAAGTVLSLGDAGRAWDLCHQHLPVGSPTVQTLSQTMWTNYLQPQAGWDALADADVMLYYNRLYGSLPKAANGPLCQNVWRRLNTHVPQMVQQMVMRDFHRIYKEVIPEANVPMHQIVPLMANFLDARSGQCTLGDLGYGLFLTSPYRHDTQLEGTVATIYQATAAAAINQLSQDSPVTSFDEYYNSPELGQVFESDADRQPLTNLLSAAVLENRLAAAEILTWSYTNAGKLGDWQAQVAAKVADPQSDADTKAFWLLVSGNVDEAKYPNPDPDNGRDIRRQRVWLDKALATAQGEPMRALILEEYTSYFRNVHRPADGVSLLASVIGQFTPGSAQRIQSLQKSLQSTQNDLDTSFQAAQAAGLKATQAAQLEDYQASLMRSQLDHNQAAVTRLQAAIANLQAQMQQNGQ